MLRHLDDKIADLDKEIDRRASADAVCRRLMTIPGIGPIAATGLVALAPPAETFRRGRDFAAWLGLTPVQRFPYVNIDNGFMPSNQVCAQLSKFAAQPTRRFCPKRVGRPACRPLALVSRLRVCRDGPAIYRHSGPLLALPYAVTQRLTGAGLENRMAQPNPRNAD